MDHVYYSRDVVFDETQIGIKNANDEDIVLLSEIQNTDNIDINDDQEYDIERIVQE